MKVVYVSDGAALYGGTKVVYQHVRGLRRLGVLAEVVSPDPTPLWFPGAESFYRQVSPLSAAGIGPADIAVGTNWFTVPIAARVSAKVTFHLCQCYEALYPAIRDRWSEIEAVYRLPTRKLAVSPHLARLIEERIGHTARFVPQPFDARVFRPPAHDRPEDGSFRLLLSGQWDLPIKGVEWAMRALRPLVYESPRLSLVRLSQDAPQEEVEFWPDADRSIQLPIELVPDLVRGVDAYLGPSTEVEGFGLPTLEAMGCARPAVLTDIGAARSIDPREEASIRVPHGDDDALRGAVRRLRDSPDLRRRLGSSGRRIAEEYSEDRTAWALFECFSEALGFRAQDLLNEPLAITRAVEEWRRQIVDEHQRATRVAERVSELGQEAVRVERQIAHLRAARSNVESRVAESNRALGRAAGLETAT